MNVTLKLVTAIRNKEPECLLFQAHQGADAPGIILFYEIFSTREAFEQHKKQEHTRQWFRDVEPFTTAPIEVMILKPIEPA